MSIRSVESRCPQRVEEAKQLALLADAVHSSSSMTTDEYRIVLFDDREELWDCRTRKHGMALSFQSVDRRIGAGNLSHKQPLGRAIGSKAQVVVDATAGFGHDASRLACMGWDVIGIERDKFLSAVLKLSLEDVTRCDDLQTLLSGRLRFIHGDATTVLNTLNPDVVYLDPMFTPRKKRSALPKKPAQILQALAKPSDDQNLLCVAQSVAPRVVVKRPIDGPSIVEPHLVFKGRLVRYDVYLNMNE
jgi:16S rRNA (guanine1516-N2)-methyltransferase